MSSLSNIGGEPTSSSSYSALASSSPPGGGSNVPTYTAERSRLLEKVFRLLSDTVRGMETLCEKMENVGGRAGKIGNAAVEVANIVDGEK